MTQDQLITKMNEIFSEALHLARKKNEDYAGDGDAFKNFRGCERHGISLGQGILVRLEDKIARIGNLLQKNAAVTGESLKDTAIDIANYAAILAVWFDNEAGPIKETLPTGGAVIYPFGLLSGTDSTANRVPGDGDSSKPKTEPSDRSDLHGDIGC